MKGITQSLPSVAVILTIVLSVQAIDSICDVGDVCAQICIPTGDSYKCACNKGFTLMADGVSCKPDKRSTRTKGDRCAINNPCQHGCIDTGVAIKCTCRDGYELAEDNTTCTDIDECATGTHMCGPNEVCTNDDGAYYCDDPNFLTGEEDVEESKCPAGYKFNYENLVCDDIDECEFDIICPRPKTCKNTIGSFKCEGEDRLQCPPGFQYKPSIDTCADVDECITGDNDCNKESQVCVNTKGNFTCVDRVSKNACPPGFKKNAITQNCDDVNECEENDFICKEHEQCVNERGGHTCIPKNTTSKPSTTSSTTTTKTTTRTTQTTSTTPKTTVSTTPKRETCTKGFKAGRNGQCEDINECREDDNACDSTQECFNYPGGYVCNCKAGFKKEHQTGACVDLNECQIGTHDCTIAQRCDNTIGSYLCARITGCGTGYTLNYANGLCEDDDECSLGTHNCNDLGINFRCRNTLGSYRCEAVRLPAPAVRPQVTPASRPTVFTPTIPQSVPTVAQPKPIIVPQPAAIPQAQPVTVPQAQPTVATQAKPATVSQSKPSTVAQTTYLPPIKQTPSFSRPTQIYPQTPLIIRNYPFISGTLRSCLPGYFMNELGMCQDINECDGNPCSRGEKCLNFNGHYKCAAATQCKIGYELDETGENCVDVNECTRGTHKCSENQICKNGKGFYTCDCLPGHHVNPNTQKCEDIDECKYYRPCAQNSECVNTVGSFKCLCKEGFRSFGNTCQDIDECKETQGLCQHKCLNLWGSHRCACEKGFTLNSDNRTCTDIDECEKFKDKKLCIGKCENVPGSYRCACPEGYRLGNDGRICHDVDECRENVCRQSDVCVNTRGSYKCYEINCPPNYFRDQQFKGRCKRMENLCDPRDFKCILMPEQYTYQYIVMVSNMPIENENILLFQITGPRWSSGRADFSMKVVKVDAANNIPKAHAGFFKMEKLPLNNMRLYLSRSIQGPQEIQLEVEMQLFRGNDMTGKMVAYVFLLVSQYEY